MGVVPRVVLAALIAAVSAALPAGAQTPPGAWPRCISERGGQQLALGGSVCECQYERGGTMIGKPPGWRWACDILKMDESVLGLPADSGRRGLPPGFVYAPQTGTQTDTDIQSGTQSGTSGVLPNGAGSWPGSAPFGVPADGGLRGPVPLLGRPPWR